MGGKSSKQKKTKKSKDPEETNGAEEGAEQTSGQIEAKVTENGESKPTENGQAAAREEDTGEVRLVSSL